MPQGRRSGWGPIGRRARRLPGVRPVSAWLARHTAARWFVAGFGLLIAALLVSEATGWRLLRTPVEAVLGRSFGTDVALEGDFRARLLWRPQLSVDRLQVQAAPVFELPHLLQATEVDLQWRWRDLWAARSGQAPLRLESLSAETLDARLVRRDDGSTSWPTASARPEAREPAASASGPRRPDTAPWPRFGRLDIGQGRIAFDDALTRTALQIEVQGGERSPTADRPVPSAPAAAQPGRGVTAQVRGRYQGAELALRIRAAAALALLDEAGRGHPIAPHAEAAEGLVPVVVQGKVAGTRVQFDGAAAALLGDRPLQGRLQMAGPSLAGVGEPFGVTLPRTPPFELDGALSHRGGLWELKAERAHIGQSRLAGHFLFDVRNRPTRLEGQLRGSRLVLDDLAPAVGAPPSGRARDDRARGRILPQRAFELPALRSMDAQVDVALDALELGHPAVRSLQALKVQVALRGGVLRLSELQAQVAGGRLRGSSELDGSAVPPRWGTTLAFERIAVAEWLHGLRVKQGRRSTPWLSGTLAGQMAFTGRGQSMAQILGSLDGDARLMVRDGSLSHLVTELFGLDVAQALGVVVRGDRSLPLRCARLEVDARDGLLTARQAVLDTRDSTLRLTGSVHLGQETFDLRATARPKDFSPLSLRTPITVGGSFAAPQVAVDSRALAGKAAGAVLLGALAGPLAAVVPLVDPGDKPEVDPCAEASAAPAAGARPARAAGESAANAGAGLPDGDQKVSR